MLKDMNDGLYQSESLGISSGTALSNGRGFDEVEFQIVLHFLLFDGSTIASFL